MKTLLIFLLSQNIQASSFEECHFSAELKHVEKDHQQVILSKVIFEQGHINNCKRFLGTKRIQIKDFDKEKAPTKKFKLRYWTYSGMGPDGPVGGTTWGMLKKDQSSNK